MRRHDQAGMALLSVLVVIMVLALLGGLVLYLAGQESQLSTVRYRAAQSLNIAEGGAWAARAALMAVVNADPTDAADFVGDVATAAVTWFAGGVAALQNPLAFLDHLRVDGQGLSTGEGPYDWVIFVVNWALPYSRLKLQFVTGGPGTPPADPLALVPALYNGLGEGWYRSVVVLWKRAEPHESCVPPGSACFVHLTPPATLEIPLGFRVVSDGQVDPQFRRRVTLEGQFRVLLGNTSFAQWLSFTHVFSLSTGTAVYFAWDEAYDGPIHTNGRFRFWGFPKFGTPDTGSPCDPARIRATRLTSTDTQAVFRRPPWIPGSPTEVTLAADEWVQGGQRIAAPVLPDCTPGNFSDDVDNPVAQFTRGFDGDPNQPGIQPITVPWDPPGRIRDSYGTLQRAVALGWNPQDTSATGPNNWTAAQWNARLRAVVPELPNNSNPVPNGIYVPNDGANLLGGIYVEGDLRELVLSNCAPGTPGFPYCPYTPGGPAYYYLRDAGGREVIVEVDRSANGGLGRTRVYHTDWDPVTAGNQSGWRTFNGVPRGFQGAPPYTLSNTIVYVHGNVGTAGSGGVWGTVEEGEQVMITAARSATESGQRDVWIPNHIRYERPPNPYDPNDNPRNLLGVYVPTGLIRIPTSSPNDLDLQGVFMAGQPGVSDGVNSELRVESVCSLPNKGYLRLLGGVIGEFAGVSGCFSGTVHGYSDRWVWDRRMGRGFAPPYFPTTTIAKVEARELATRKPQWREASPP
jgi:type II secretory pathway pseudopilin PulG